jgi:hypothetical protein
VNRTTNLLVETSCDERSYTSVDVGDRHVHVAVATVSSSFSSLPSSGHYDSSVRTVACLLFVAACGFRSSGASSGGRDATVAHDDAASNSDAATGIDAPIADATADSPTIPCPTDYVTLPGTSGRYKVFAWSSNPNNNRSQPWITAAATCSGEGTHLAFPASASEAAAIEAVVAVDPASPYIWAGLTDAALEGTWKTSLGTAASYLPWASGQPNGATSANCALEAGGKLYDWTCATPYPFLCQCN